jgi:hypothetical protein
MTSTNEILAIQNRQREIAAEMEALRAEAEELETTLRVLRRYGVVAVAKMNGEQSPETKLGPARPEGTPSLFEMAAMVIREANEEGKEGLTGRQLVGAIGKRFWPGVQDKQVLPPIYQFAKKGRLVKTANGIFKLPEKLKDAP